MYVFHNLCALNQCSKRKIPLLTAVGNLSHYNYIIAFLICQVPIYTKKHIFNIFFGIFHNFLMYAKKPDPEGSGFSARSVNLRSNLSRSTSQYFITHFAAAADFPQLTIFVMSSAVTSGLPDIFSSLIGRAVFQPSYLLNASPDVEAIA